jgi:hypothetical protein
MKLTPTKKIKSEEKIIDVLRDEYLDKNIQFRQDTTLRWTITSALLFAEGYVYLEIFSKCMPYKLTLCLATIIISLAILAINVFFEYRLGYNSYSRMIIIGKINYYFGKKVLFWPKETERLTHIVFNRKRKGTSLGALFILSLAAFIIIVIPTFLTVCLNCNTSLLLRILIPTSFGLVVAIAVMIIYSLSENSFKTFFKSENKYIANSI